MLSTLWSAFLVDVLLSVSQSCGDEYDHLLSWLRLGIGGLFCFHGRVKKSWGMLRPVHARNPSNTFWSNRALSKTGWCGRLRNALWRRLSLSVCFDPASWQAFPLHSGVNITLLSSPVTLCLVTLHFS